MPSINSRLANNIDTNFIKSAVPMEPMSPKVPAISMSGAPAQEQVPNPNPSPNRSLTPEEYMYDFETHKLYPQKFTFRRRFTDESTRVRNLALQAAAKAGLVIQ